MMMKKKLISKLLVVAMSASLLTGVSQPVFAAETATISGTLLAADGTPLANKTVTLRERSANDRSGRYTATTDASGQYTAEVPAGSYQVIGFPYEFNSAKQGGTADPEQICAAVQCVTADEGTEVTQDLQVPEPVTVPNGEFEDGGKGPDMPPWTFGGTSSGGSHKVGDKNRHSGNGNLGYYDSKEFTANVYQQITDLENGTYVIQYSLEAEVEDSDDAYFYVKNAGGEMIAREQVRSSAPTENYEVFCMTAEVTDGTMTIGLEGKCSATKWINVDELRMGKVSKPQTYSKEELGALLQSAAGYQADSYTAASFATFSAAKEKAQQVYDQGNAAVSAITEAYNALQSAIDGLVPQKTEADPDIRNDVFWRDTNGNVIYSQGGGIFKFGDTYYWYGVKYDQAVQYAANPTTKYEQDSFAGVTCYTSKDLVNWEYKGLVVKPEEVSGHEDMKGQDAAWVGRLGVAKVGDQYALLVQHECAEVATTQEDAMDYPDTEQDSVSKQVLVLTAGTPDGEFKWNQRINMTNYTGGTSNTGDQTVFTDEDTGKSYLVYSYGRGRGSMFLSEIVAQEDGKVGLAKSHMIYKGAGREGNCMFKYNGKYYVCASDLYGWNASHAYYLVLDSLEDSYLDTFEPVTSMKLMDGSSDDFCHVTQTGFFYTVKGSEQETVIFCGDRWAEFAQNGLGFNQWCPLSFKEDGTPCFNSLSAWDLDIATGKWTIHETNNYVKNGSFDADRVSQTQLAGWTNTVSKGNSPISNNSTKVTGKYALKLGDSVDFDCKVSQVIAQDTETADAVVLPDGTYDMTAQVKNSGTFQELSLYAKSGNLTKKTVVSQDNASYSEVTVKDVAVTGGKAEVGFIAKGSANASALIDDVTFVRSADASAAEGSIEVPMASNVAKNVTLTMTSEDGTVVYVYEDVLANGNKTLTVDSVAPGKYTVQISVNAAEVANGSQEVTVTAGETAKLEAVTVANKGGNVTGKVADAAGSGIEGVNVTITLGENVLQTKTDADGTYSFEDVLAGTYTVRMEKEGYDSPEQFEVTVAVGETTNAAQQTMRSAMGTIKGIVRNTAGEPVANAAVSLRGCAKGDSDKRYKTQTGEDGTFSINVIEDTYQILASQEGAAVCGAAAEKIAVVREQSYETEVIIPEQIPVPNGDFETDFAVDSSWTSTGSRGKWTNRAADVLSGKGGYNIWDEKSAYTVNLSQTLKGLANGTYVVTVKADTAYNAGDELYLFAKDAQGNLLAREDFPSLHIVEGGETLALTATVEDGTLTIGVAGNLTGGAWSHVDDICVGCVKAVAEPEPEKPSVADVEALIGQIGSVEATEACKAKIDAAKEAYDKLTDEEKASVSNYSVLEAAIAEYDRLTNPPAETKTDIRKAKVAAIKTQTYTGKALKPSVKVTYGGKTLVSGKDYKVTYSNNKNIGKASVKITGIGKYENSVTKSFTITVKKNKTYTVGSYKYKITNANTSGKGTVAVAGVKSKSIKSVKIGATVKIGGKTFKITSIGKGAFKSCKKLASVTIGSNVTKIEQSAFEKCAKLKKIKISSTKLSSVGKNAIKGIYGKASIQCPKKQLAKYKKLFKSSTGFKKTMKIKK